MRLLAVGLVSAGVLGYEVLLARLFSIIQWHHFAYMIISVALLGFGASGTAIALLEKRLRPRATPIFAASAQPGAGADRRARPARRRGRIGIAGSQCLVASIRRSTILGDQFPITS